MISILRGVAFGLGIVLGTACRADGASIAKNGVGAAQACQTCHAGAGQGLAQAGFPRLAALGAPYLQRQLNAFANGTRVNAVMMPIAQALSAADRAAVSAYYAALPEPTGTGTGTATPVPKPTTTTTTTSPRAPATAQPAASAAASAVLWPPTGVGATLATRGRWAEQLPACEQCHGPGGRGAGPDFPALTGQSAAYLVNQLAAWKSGTRPPGPMGLMAVVASKLSDAEMRAVADHFASLPLGAAR